MFVIFFILAKFWRKKSSLFKVRKTGGNPVGNGPRGRPLRAAACPLCCSLLTNSTVYCFSPGQARAPRPGPCGWPGGCGFSGSLLRCLAALFKRCGSRRMCPHREPFPENFCVPECLSPKYLKAPYFAGPWPGQAPAAGPEGAAFRARCYVAWQHSLNGVAQSVGCARIEHRPLEGVVLFFFF